MRLSPSRFAALASTIMLGCLLKHSPLCAQEDNHSGMVLVQRTVDSRYLENESSLSMLLKTNLTRTYKVKLGDTLQSIVSKHFLVGPASSNFAYDQITSKIRTTNDLTGSRALIAGETLRLPDIPPTQWKTSVPGNPNYGIPRIQLAQSEADKEAGVANVTLTDSGRKAESSVTQWLWISPEQAKAEAQLGNTEGAITDYMWTQPITVKFADGHATAQEGTIQDDANFVSRLIQRRKPENDVVVFILDDSWPTESTFESSREFLVDALDRIAAKNYLPRPSWPEEIRNGSATTNFPLQSTGRHSHASSIVTSLTPFQSLSTKIHVVYLPLFTEQKWSTEIWRELANVALVAKSMHASLGTMEPPADVVKQSRRTATDLINAMPSKAIDEAGVIQQAPVTVLNHIAQLYAETTGTPYFISMSWTVEKHELEFGPDPDSLGLSLAASGNDRKDVVANSIYMAYRAKAFPGDVLAVMNTDRAGDLHCDSSRLPVSGSGIFYGLAYDGTISGTAPACATSFSTPRVAWLLALREAYRAPVAAADRPYWFASYRNTLLSLQDATQASSKRYLLSVPKLFSGL